MERPHRAAAEKANAGIKKLANAELEETRLAIEKITSTTKKHKPNEPAPTGVDGTADGPAARTGPLSAFETLPLELRLAILQQVADSPLTVLSLMRLSKVWYDTFNRGGVEDRVWVNLCRELGVKQRSGRGKSWRTTWYANMRRKCLACLEATNLRFGPIWTDGIEWAVVCYNCQSTEGYFQVVPDYLAEENCRAELSDLADLPFINRDGSKRYWKIAVLEVVKKRNLREASENALREATLRSLGKRRRDARRANHSERMQIARELSINAFSGSIEALKDAFRAGEENRYPVSLELNSLVKGTFEAGIDYVKDDAHLHSIVEYHACIKALIAKVNTALKKLGIPCDVHLIALDKTIGHWAHIQWVDYLADCKGRESKERFERYIDAAIRAYKPIKDLAAKNAEEARQKQVDEQIAFFCEIVPGVGPHSAALAKFGKNRDAELEHILEYHRSVRAVVRAVGVALKAVGLDQERHAPALDHIIGNHRDGFAGVWIDELSSNTSAVSISDYIGAALQVREDRRLEEEKRAADRIIAIAEAERNARMSAIVHIIAKRNKQGWKKSLRKAILHEEEGRYPHSLVLKQLMAPVITAMNTPSDEPPTREYLRDAVSFFREIKETQMASQLALNRIGAAPRPSFHDSYHLNDVYLSKMTEGEGNGSSAGPKTWIDALVNKTATMDAYVAALLRASTPASA